MSIRDVLCETAQPVIWDELPDYLEWQDLARVLRVGRDAAYAFMRQHPGLVVRAGNTKRVPKEGLRRFMARDPEVMKVAFVDPYANLKATVRPAPVRGAHLRAVPGGLR